MLGLLGCDTSVLEIHAMVFHPFLSLLSVPIFTKFVPVLQQSGVINGVSEVGEGMTTFQGRKEHFSYLVISLLVSILFHAFEGLCRGQWFYPYYLLPVLRKQLADGYFVVFGYAYAAVRDIHVIEMFKRIIILFQCISNLVYELLARFCL